MLDLFNSGVHYSLIFFIFIANKFHRKKEIVRNLFPKLSVVIMLDNKMQSRNQSIICSVYQEAKKQQDLSCRSNTKTKQQIQFVTKISMN